MATRWLPDRRVDPRRAAAGGRRHWRAHQREPIDDRRARGRTCGPTQVRTEVATGESDLSGILHGYKLRVIDLRVGDCFDLKDEYADEIKDVKTVPCKTKHRFEVFYVGAMGKGSYPWEDAGTYAAQNCEPAFRAYIGKAYDDSDLYIYWLAPTESTWRSGDRTVQCAAYYPRIDRLTRSLRGTRQ